MIEVFLEPLRYEFFVRAILAAVLVALVCAVVGSHMVLRGLAFMGDAISHAAFPGVVVAYLVKAPFYFGGAIAAMATALAIGFIGRHSRLRSDTSIGVLFAGMFALGIVLFSGIPNYVPDLFGFLFGNVLAITSEDLLGLAGLSLVVLLVMAAFWKELLYATFDPLGAAASGLHVGRLDYLFLGVIALTIIVSLQAVGIILVVAMLTTPAATAQLLTDRVGRLMLVAVGIGAGSAIGGLYLSYFRDVPSGATIVIVQTTVFLAVLALARGGRSGPNAAARS